MPPASYGRCTVYIGGVPIAVASEATLMPKRVRTSAVCNVRGRYEASGAFTIKTGRPFKGRAGEAYKRRKAWRAIASPQRMVRR